MAEKSMISKTKINKQEDKKSKVSARWKDEHVEQLINCISSYKTTMAFNGKDFDADKKRLYSDLRKMMAERGYVVMFGPENPTPIDNDIDLSEEGKEIQKGLRKVELGHIERGRKRLQEKVKEIRQNFSKAVTSGTRSGSGKIVVEHYDKLMQLWGGSANTKPLSFGVQNDDFIIEGEEKENLHEINNDESTTTGSIDAPSSSKDVNYSSNEYSSDDETISKDITKNAEGTKRKANNIDIVPKLVDKKRRHLERNLSSAQRDKMLIDEAKQDSQFRKDLTEAMRESSKTFATSMENVGKSMTDLLGSSICKSIEMLSQAMCSNNNPNNMMPHNTYFNGNYAYQPLQQQQYQGYYSQFLHGNDPRGEFPSSEK